MRLDKIELIINKIEGDGVFQYDTPLVFYRIDKIVNSFDWSAAYVEYNKSRVIFKTNGLYYVVPVLEVPTEPVGVVGQDYDIVGGKFWLYQKPNGRLTYDVLSTDRIGSFSIKPLVSGGVVDAN